MPRQRLGDNVQRIRDAATSVFAEKGYRRTRMADIAAVAGVSPGALYRYVESKDALLLLVFSSSTGASSTLPIRTPSRTELVTAIGERLTELGRTPRLRAALQRRRPSADVSGELREILEERYDLVAAAWPLLAVLERSAVDIPELFDLYFHHARRQLTDQIAHYLDQRQRNGVRRFPDSRLAARFVEESLTWFAWHRHDDPDSADLTDDDARATAVLMNLHALVRSPATGA